VLDWVAQVLEAGCSDGSRNLWTFGPEDRVGREDNDVETKTPLFVAFKEVMGKTKSHLSSVAVRRVKAPRSMV
jgi:hypothetical protein